MPGIAEQPPIKQIVEQFAGRSPSKEAHELARPIANAKIEGEQIISSVVDKLGEEQKAAVVADEQGQIIELSKAGIVVSTKENAVMLKYAKGKKKLSPEDEKILQRIEDSEEPLINPRQLVREARAAERAQREAENNLREARGNQPDVSYSREKKTVDRMEAKQEVQVAAGLEIARTLNEALARSDGLNSADLSQATLYARTFSRADRYIVKQMGNLADQLIARFPAEANNLRGQLESFAERSTQDKAVEAPEMQQLTNEQVVERAQKLVDTFGLQREVSINEVLNILGIEITSDNEGKKFQSREGSLAERLFSTTDYSEALDESLRTQLSELSSKPLRAVGVLEVAQMTMQQDMLKTYFQIQIDELRLTSTAKEQVIISEEIARTGKDRDAIDKSYLRRKRVEEVYKSVASRIGNKATQVGAMLQEKILHTAEIIKTAVDRTSSYLIDTGKSFGMDAADIDRVITESITSRQSDRETNIQALEEKIQLLQSELDRARSGGAV